VWWSLPKIARGTTSRTKMRQRHPPKRHKSPIWTAELGCDVRIKGNPESWHQKIGTSTKRQLELVHQSNLSEANPVNKSNQHHGALLLHSSLAPPSSHRSNTHLNDSRTNRLWASLLFLAHELLLCCEQANGHSHCELGSSKTLSLSGPPGPLVVREFSQMYVQGTDGGCRK